MDPKDRDYKLMLEAKVAIRAIVNNLMQLTDKHAKIEISCSGKNRREIFEAYVDIELLERDE